MCSGGIEGEEADCYGHSSNPSPKASSRIKRLSRIFDAHHSSITTQRKEQWLDFVRSVARNSGSSTVVLCVRNAELLRKLKLL